VPGATAADLHGRAVAAAARGRHATAHRLLTEALLARPEPGLRAHILVSLAYHVAERQSLAAGLALLDEAAAGADLPPRVQALVRSQRGLLYVRAGRAADALREFDATLRLLDESHPEDLCRALLNRALVHEQQRSLGKGRADLTRLIDVATRHGLDILAAKALNNLGCMSLIAGDLVLALRQLDEAAVTLRPLSPAIGATCFLDRAQVLLAAGLTREADADLVSAADMYAAGHISQGQGEAELGRAQVALIEERWDDAARLARQARRRFRRRGADAWALAAEFVAVAATVGGGRGLGRAATDAARLAGDLAAAGLDDEARRAALMGAAARLDLGDATGARAIAGSALRLRGTDPLVSRLHARAVRAGLAEAGDRRRLAAAERRAGLRDLHRYQASFGSLDLQVALSGHGRRLAREGLARAVDTGPAAAFAWAEQARALSSRLPAADPDAAALLRELRQARAERREQALAGTVDPALRRRCGELERLLRQRSWQLAGRGAAARPVTLRQVRDELAPVDGTLVAHIIAAGQLHAVVASGRARELRRLGPAAPALELLRRVRSDFDVLADGNAPAPFLAAVSAASRDGLDRLDGALLAPLRRQLRPGPLLLVPPAELAGVPWPLLASAAPRPITVAASATSWLAARSRRPLAGGPRGPAAGGSDAAAGGAGSGAPPAGGRAAAVVGGAAAGGPRVVLVAGPRLVRGPDEVRRAAAAWRGSSVLAGADAGTAAVLTAAGHADVLHVAAHGVHEVGNPLFSHLELADGPLFGHELALLPRLPAHVVLSACELGRSEPRPGDETLGMTAALLHGGAGSVIAAVARLSDATACLVGAAHHAGLRRGLAPAAALAAAIGAAAAEPAPLVCFGSGW
jgi:hypothetical protein